MVVRTEPLPARAREGDRAVAVAQHSGISAPAAPYRGIQSFRYEDHAIFFAREDEKRELASLVSVYRGVMLYGDSGAGKSSLVNAGLLPQAVSQGFAPLIVRVQANAGKELVIARLDHEASSVLGTDEFHAELKRMSETGRPLVVFDQFEELVTLFTDANAAAPQKAVVKLIEKVLHGELPVKLLLAFRDDYLGKVKQLLESCPELMDHVLALTPPAKQTLPDIIGGPFRQHRFDHALSPELIDRLCATLGARFGTGEVSLTEVQIVCERLWRSQDPGALLDAKGVHGILEDYLDEALAALSPEEREAAVALLARMVTDAGTRNVISRGDLIASVTAGGEGIPEAVLENALKKLEHPSRLVRHEDRLGVAIFEIASEFLLPAVDRRRRELQAARERRRYQRRLRVVVAVAVALLIVAGVVVALYVKGSHAERRAKSIALASTANETLSTRPDASLLLALAATQVSKTDDARAAMIAALENARRSGAVGILHGHSGGVGNVVFSPNGHLLASAGFDGTIRLWDPVSHRQLGAPLRGNRSFVNGVAFSPDGRTLASAGEDGTIRLWSVAARKQTRPAFGGDHGRILDVAFSPDGTLLASAGEDSIVRLWDARTGSPRAELKGHQAAVYALDFSRDGRLLASSSDDDSVRLWDGHTGAFIAKLDGQGTRVRNVAFNPDGTILAAAADAKSTAGCVADVTNCGNVWLWNVRTRKRIGDPLIGQRGNIRGVAFSPDGMTLATASYDKTVQLWDVDSRKPLGPPLKGPTVFISNVAFSPHGSLLAASSFDQTIRLWDVRKGRVLGTPLGGADVLAEAVAFDPRGSILASAQGSAIDLWDVGSHTKAGSLQGAEGAVRGIAFAPDGRHLALAESGGTQVADVAESEAPRATGHA